MIIISILAMALTVVAPGGIAVACFILWRRHRTGLTAAMLACQCVLFVAGVTVRFFAQQIFTFGTQLFGNDYGILTTIISIFSLLVTLVFALLFIRFALQSSPQRTD